MRGSVVMKVNDKQAHVCLGDGEVKEGDRVALYKNDCQPRPRFAARGSYSSCQKVLVGKGTVTKVLNEHYSEVEVDPGVPFEEGTTVEKL
jgi:hypothetical protein